MFAFFIPLTISESVLTILIKVLAQVDNSKDKGNNNRLYDAHLHQQGFLDHSQEITPGQRLKLS